MTPDPDTPWNHLVDRRYSDRDELPIRRRYRAKLTIRHATASEIAEWRQMVADGLPSIALDIFGALLAERGEDA